jgi:multiple sugar transport system substrate-binding protein
MSNGILMDITDRIASSSVTDMSKFPPELVSLYSYGGRQFGIPKDLDTIALWYNKKLFDEAGVPYPDATWNWDTLLDATRRLSTGDVFGFSAAISGQSNYWPFVFQNHGWIITDDWTKSGYDDPRTIEALQFLADMVRNGYSPGPSVFAENDQYVLFQSGVLAMAPIGSWMVGEMNRNAYIRENAGISVMPAGRDGTRATIMNGLGWVANAATKKTGRSLEAS